MTSRLLAPRQEDIDVVRLLIANGAKVHPTRRKTKRDFLVATAKHDRHEVVKLLRDSGAGIDLQFGGQTIGDIAVCREAENGTELL